MGLLKLISRYNETKLYFLWRGPQIISPCSTCIKVSFTVELYKINLLKFIASCLNILLIVKNLMQRLNNIFYLLSESEFKTLIQTNERNYYCVYYLKSFIQAEDLARKAPIHDNKSAIPVYVLLNILITNIILKLFPIWQQVGQLGDLCSPHLQIQTLLVDSWIR